MTVQFQDGDGHISYADLEKVMVAQCQPLTKDEMRAMIEFADADADGFVSFEEFFLVIAE